MDITNLLEEIITINQNYETELKQTGENFNIFNILGFSKDELTHSKIINEFLDPNGSHGKGDAFLKLFLEELDITDFNTENTSTDTEKFIGFITDDETNGGRIDIVITNKNQQIYIENKIEAGDQKNQLLRYHNNNPKATLLYLTKDGRKATEYSSGNRELNYQKISYQSDILNWLKKCMDISEDNPIVKETIKQYIVLIKQLTGQSRRDKMKDECIKTIIKDGNYVAAAFVISENFNELRNYIIQKIFFPKLSERIKKHGLVMRDDISVKELEGPETNPGSFHLCNPAWKYITFSFEFKNELSGLCYGIKWKDNVEKPKELTKYFEEKVKDSGFTPTKFWPLFKTMNKYANWDKGFFAEIVDNDSNAINVFEDTINELLLAIKDYKGEL